MRYMVIWNILALVIAVVLAYFVFTAAISAVWLIGWILIGLVIWALLAEALEGVWAGSLIALIIVLALLFHFVF